MDGIMNSIWSVSSSGERTPESLTSSSCSISDAEDNGTISFKKFKKSPVTDMDPAIEKTFESPFTWKIDKNLALNFEEDLEVDTHLDEQPVISLVETIGMVYIYVIKNDVEKARQKMKAVTDILKHIDFNKILSKERIVPLVLKHIIEATRYYLRKHEIGSMSELELIQFIATIPSIKGKGSTIEDDAAAAHGTLCGCKSIIWSMFHEERIVETLRYAREAVKYNPKCALWHFVLGKNLRRQRRLDNFYSQPSLEESDHLLVAYELSASDPYYGIFVAQMFRESRQRNKAERLCRSIHAVSKTRGGVGVKLRLALSFIRSREYALAEECLVLVRSVAPLSALINNSMYLHYVGIYLSERDRDYARAAKYFYEAGKLGNSKAELQYVDTMVRLQPNFDCIQYYKNMTKKYEGQKHVVQQLALQIAMQYFYRTRDIKNALIYFTKAIVIDPKSNQLKHFRSRLVDNRDYNIFNFICDRVLREFDRTYSYIPEDMKYIYEFLKRMILKNANSWT